MQKFFAHQPLAMEALKFLPLDDFHKLLTEFNYLKVYSDGSMLTIPREDSSLTPTSTLKPVHSPEQLLYARCKKHFKTYLNVNDIYSNELFSIFLSDQELFRYYN